MKHFLLELLEEVTFTIKVKCYELILLARFTCKIQAISMNKCFIVLAPGEEEGVLWGCLNVLDSPLKTANDR